MSHRGLMGAATALIIVAGTLTFINPRTGEAQVGSTPVRVVNLASSPALVRDVDRVGKEVYQEGASISLGAGAALSSFTFREVPLGKRLVVEHFSVLLQVPSGQTARASLGAGPPLLFHYVPLMLQASFLSSDSLVASEFLRLYVGPGSEPITTIARNSVTGSVTGNATISGYLIDVVP